MNKQKIESILIRIIYVLAFITLLNVKHAFGQGMFTQVDDLPYVATDIAFGEDGSRFVSLQQGVVLKNSDTLLTVPVWFLNEMGLVALLPVEHYLYLHCSGVDSIQRIIRYDTIAQVFDTIVEADYSGPPFFTNHRGGDIIKVDSFLYSSFGYGADRNNSQNQNNFLGKVIQTNLNNNTNSIYVDGLRNPFRMAYDTIYEGLWVADVGSDVAEEVNLFYEGDSGGWPCWEGDSLIVVEDTCWASVFPIYHYSQAQPRYIIGGDFYEYNYHWADAGSGIGGYIDSMGSNTTMLYPKDLTSMTTHPLTEQLYVITWIGKIYLYIPDTTVLALPEDWEEEEDPSKPWEPPLWYFDYCEGYIDVLGRHWVSPPIGVIVFDCYNRKRILKLNE